MQAQSLNSLIEQGVAKGTFFHSSPHCARRCHVADFALTPAISQRATSAWPSPEDSSPSLESSLLGSCARRPGSDQGSDPTCRRPSPSPIPIVFVPPGPFPPLSECETPSSPYTSHSKREMQMQIIMVLSIFLSLACGGRQ